MSRVEDQFVSEFISFAAGDLARLAAGELVARFPAIARRYGPMPEVKWRDNFASRLGELAAALSAGRPEIFAQQVAWSKAAFAARRVPIDDLRVSLGVLRDVVAQACPPEDRDRVELAFARAVAALDLAPDHVPTELSVRTPHGKLAAAYLLALLEGDRVGASRLILNAAAAGTLDVRSAYLDVFVPVQRELGRMWHMNEVTVAEEHFCTATTQMVMSQLMGMTRDRKPYDGRVVLAASVEGNTHDLGVRFVADFFELEGWRAIYLGPSVPVPDLVQGAHDFGAHLVALSATLATQLRAAEDTIASLRASVSSPSLRVIVGGLGFAAAPDAWRTMGADGFAADAREAIMLGDRLVPRPGAETTPKG